MLAEKKDMAVKITLDPKVTRLSAGDRISVQIIGEVESGYTQEELLEAYRIQQECVRLSAK